MSAIAGGEYRIPPVFALSRSRRSRRPETLPTEPAVRRRAIGTLVAEIRSRELAGQALRTYVYNLRAVDPDLALDVALAILAPLTLVSPPSPGTAPSGRLQQPGETPGLL